MYFQIQMNLFISVFAMPNEIHGVCCGFQFGITPRNYT